MQTIELAWGTGGARALLADCDLLVVVDVLSFTTCVSIATTRGALVRPADLFAQHGALEPGEMLAGPRDGPGPTLSPQSLRELQPGQRIVLPSPNGSAVAASLNGAPCVAASLRNAGAVASWLADREGRIGFVAAGEHDEEGRWRPAYEDAVGAGAVIARLGGVRTPQAQAAVAGFEAARVDLPARLAKSRSGAELAARRFAGDVALASELDVDTVVPVLRDGVFTADA